jgi:thermitase
MKSPSKAHRRRLAVESLEPRALLTGYPDGMWPLPNPGPDTSIFVRFADDDPPAHRQSALRALGASVVTSYPDGPDLITLGDGISPDAALKQLRADPGVQYATPDSIIHATAVAGGPSDPAYGQLWGLNNSNNVDVDEPEAWGVTLGNPSTIVAVLDTGIDLFNPDFAGKIWTNFANDASQGYPGDVHGWNFINNTPDVRDNDGHGTHVSAIIAAIGNNNDGVVGVDPSAQIMPLKFLDAQGNGSTDAAMSAIYYAVNHGARVINASWGGVDYSAPLANAIAYANAHNVVFVTAAGNDGTNNDVIPSYPASFRQPNELSVASVDRFGNLAGFSNYGASTVDLAAPGVDIISDVPTSIDPSGLQLLSGTSMSTAYVSGVAALVAGINPSLTASQIVHRLDSTAKPLPSLTGRTISGGMVDAYNAVVASGVSTAGSTPVAGLPILTPGASSQADLHASILASDEYFSVHGGTAVGFLAGLYVDVLGHVPDPAGLQQWAVAYNSGTLTRFEIARAFMTSPEGRVAEVARWFQTDLGRSTALEILEADPGIGAWANLLLQGWGDNTVEAAIMSSFEYLAGHGGSPFPIVQGYYQDLTGRAADQAGQSYWAGLLYQGLAPFNVLRTFQATPEVAQTRVATWFIQDLGRTASLDQLKANPGIQSLAGLLGNS